MTEVGEYIEVNGRRIAVTAENLIKAYEALEKKERLLESLGRRLYDLESDRSKTLYY